MKKAIYVLGFTVLGVLMSFLVHIGVEVLYIKLLIADFQYYSFGLSWEQWFKIHDIGSIILLVLGIIFGYQQGRYWWDYIYVKGGRSRLR